MERRSLLKTAALGILATPIDRLRASLPEGALGSQLLDALPGKRPLLKRTFRPPNYETPLASLNAELTPNDAFFVRWHLANIPSTTGASWRLKVEGAAAGQTLELDLDTLRREFEPAEVIAVCQCAGNQRGLTNPHVPGVQWARGAVGNARWRGARLKDVLARCDLKPELLEVAFSGGDRPVLTATPAFAKSLPAWKALDESTLIAYEMNGAPLPHWNGAPARLVVPGWMGTYWVKQLTRIEPRSQPLSNFWMATAYRVPKDKFPITTPFASQEAEASYPVTEIDVNSVITNLDDGQRLPAGAAFTVHGIAWDSGSGIRQVEVSMDGGHSWKRGELGPDRGRFSFRTWKARGVPQQRGALAIAVRATSGRGLVQPDTWTVNPAGYHNNIVHTVTVEVV